MKKKLCIIHIGMPKTGSTALQENLYHNISDINVSYANLPTASHSAIMFSLFSSHPESLYLHKSKKHSNEEIENFNRHHRNLLIKGFTEHSSSIEIISGEDIFHIDRDGLVKMKNFIKNYFDKILIVGYVRAPKSFMESAFQQLVKYHSLGSFNFSLIYPHYRQKFEKFDTVFGQRNVLLWKFDPQNFPQNDITLDFCTKLNITINTKKLLRANDAISQEAISLLFASHKYGKELDLGKGSLEIYNELIKRISTIGHKKFKFSKILIEKIFSQYQNDITWMEKRLGESLQEEFIDNNEGINSEKELLQFSQSTVKQLEEIIDEKETNINTSPPDIAKLMDKLKLKIASELGIPAGKEIEKNMHTMTIEEKKEYDKLASFSINWDNYHMVNNIEDKDVDPILHYIRSWKIRNLIIDNVFDTEFYLKTYPDIKKSNLNPLIHYMQHGKKEGRKGMVK